MDFFLRQIESKGLDNTVEQWLFSADVNTPQGAHGSAKMLIRLHAGLVHALIHVGYGVEFGLPGMVIEGASSVYELTLPSCV